MATYYAPNAGPTDQPAAGIGMHIAHGTYTLDTTNEPLGNGDFVDLVKVPKGARIIQILLFMEDLETTSSSSLDLGDYADDDRWQSANIDGRTGNYRKIDRTVGGDVFYEYTTDDTIRILWNTAPGTDINGAKIKIAVKYNMAQQ